MAYRTYYERAYRRHDAARDAARYTCPTCKRPNVLSPREAARGYQCVDCTRRDAADYGNEAW